MLRLQKIFLRMQNVGVAKAFDHWICTLEAQDTRSKIERDAAMIKSLKKLSRAWRVWRRFSAEQFSRRRMNETFKFSKQSEEDQYAEATDWRSSLARGRTRNSEF